MGPQSQDLRFRTRKSVTGGLRFAATTAYSLATFQVAEDVNKGGCRLPKPHAGSRE